MKYRSRGEIISDILRVVASNKATKTRLMYGAYLSFSQIEEYLGYILQQGLITQEPGTNLYRLSENGMKYLNLSNELSQLLVAPIQKRPMKESSML
ncbi:MAG: winged helix-turn-helix domain-containing protein [Nitrososphaerales archaeon]